MKTSAKAIIVCSILGFLNALYLTTVFIQKTWFGKTESSVCDINSTLNCSSVITSPFGKFLGVPVCTVAMVIYPVLTVLGILALRRTKTRNLFFAISILSAMGFMMNVIYIYNELTYLGAFCLFCSICGVIILTNLIMGIIGYSKSKK